MVSFFRALALFLIIFTFQLSTVRADQYLNTLRVDNNVPEHCREPKIEHFMTDYKIVMWSIHGALEKGFTHEYPQNRECMAQLWDIFRDNSVQVLAKSGFRSPKSCEYGDRDFKLLLENAEERGYDFDKEGDVLELLANLTLEQEYGTDEYFSSSGIEYRMPGERTLGELDVIIQRRDNCQAVVVGEAKLGLKALSKARDQVSRFRNYLAQLGHQNQNQNPSQKKKKNKH